MKRNSTRNIEPKDELLPRITQWFFRHKQLTAFLWVIVVVFGILSYTTLLKREGFPSIQFPFSVVNGAYFVNNSATVDSEVTKPLTELILERSEVKTVQSQSFANFYVVQIQYNEGTDAAAVTKAIKEDAVRHNSVPKQATANFTVPKFGFTQRGDDLVISVFREDGSLTTEQLTRQAQRVVRFIEQQNPQYVDDISVIDPFEKGVDPTTGQTLVNQKIFDRFGERKADRNTFYTSVAIGATRKSNADVLKFNDEIESALARLNGDKSFDGLSAQVSASFAPSIRTQISELQKVLLEGLIAVLFVGSIVIAVRASIITVISMVTVLAVTLGVLYLFGYSLNTITLFALILGLSLIVDDTIIMVEALEAQRKRQKNAASAVQTATRKVSRAMVAATLTAALSFAPLLFVGGILGGFIRAIPVTIITALLVSLLVALLFIPLFARFLLLGKNQMGEKNVKEPGAALEAKIARYISAPMLWAKGSTKKLFGVGIVALIIGFGFIFAGSYLGKYVSFNIFPEDKDANQLAVTLAFPPMTSISAAESIAEEADKIISNTIGINFSQASYYATGDTQGARLSIDLTDYNSRETKSPEIVKQLETAFEDFNKANVQVAQVSAGPPASAFTVQIDASNRDAALLAAKDIAAYFENEVVLKRSDNSIAKIKRVTVSNDDVVTRTNGKVYVAVAIEFVDKDTSTLVALAETAVKKEFDTSRLKEYGLADNTLSFTSGQEDENQNSFKMLVAAFPLLLAGIYLLLAIQFRSLLQPLLIFMALPFSLLGITLGLYVTDNAFSFFAMLGFFALIGLSIKNTILLTDYANQSRRAGMGAVDAAHEALAERFRPLVATSLTAVVSLIPLALTSPFWEGLAVVLIFGLLSSTFLVVTVFPYYYLGAEYLRMGVNRRVGLLWVSITLVLIFLAMYSVNNDIASTIGALILASSFTGVVWYAHRNHRRMRNKISAKTATMSVRGGSKKVKKSSSK